MQDHFEESYMGKLWYIVLGEDKRSFNEYFSEEHGLTLNDDITEDQLSFLVINLLVGENCSIRLGNPTDTVFKKLKKIKKLNNKMGVIFNSPLYGI